MKRSKTIFLSALTLALLLVAKYSYPATVPHFRKIITNLASEVTGTLPVTNGGTGLATIAANRLLYTSSSDTLAALSLGTGLSFSGATLIVDLTANYAWTGHHTFDGRIDDGTVETFTDSDATPDVSTGGYFNTNTSAVTITDFDGSGISDGQIITVISKGAITFDCTGAGFKCGTTDIVTAAGDVTGWRYDGTDWYLLFFTNQSDNINEDGGGGGGGTWHKSGPVTGLMSRKCPLAECDGFAPPDKDTGTYVTHSRTFVDTDDTSSCYDGILPSNIDTTGDTVFGFSWYSKTATSGSAQLYITEKTMDEGEGWDAAGDKHAFASDAVQGTVDQKTHSFVTVSTSTLGWQPSDEIEVCFARDGDGTAGTDDVSGSIQGTAWSIEVDLT